MVKKEEMRILLAPLAAYVSKLDALAHTHPRYFFALDVYKYMARRR